MARRIAKGRGCFSRLLGLGFLIVIVAAGLAAYWMFTPYSGHTGEVFIEVERGTSSRQIAEDLAREGVVRSAYAFLLVRMAHPHSTLQAGEYQFASPESPWDVFEKIHRGQVYFREVTFPEGSNMFDMANIVAGTGVVTSEAFLKAASDPSLVRDIDREAPNLEGFLFPSTYRITKASTAEELCRTMTAQFRKQWALAGGNEYKGQVHSAITIASLVEKETAVAEERPLVAAVFYNRLAKNMLLQCDPTTVYAALRRNRYTGVIHKSDLESEDPYNTYTHAGLPPGPIANPGLSALKAALHPAKSDYLYFVAKPGGSGTHQFSSTLDAHEKAVAAYRRGAR